MEPVSRISQHFTHNANFQSLSDNRVNDLFIDDDGRVWVATQSGIDLFDFSKNAFRSVINAQRAAVMPSDLDSFVFTHLAQDKNGLIWAGNTSNGLLSMVVNSGRFLWLKPDDNALNAPHRESVLALLEDAPSWFTGSRSAVCGGNRWFALACLQQRHQSLQSTYLHHRLDQRLLRHA